MSSLEPTVDMSLACIRGFIAGEVTLQELYDSADRLWEWLHDHREQTPETNQIRVIEGLLSVACIMSRAGETGAETKEYLQGLVDEFAEEGWRARVASGWWPWEPSQNLSRWQ